MARAGDRVFGEEFAEFTLASVCCLNGLTSHKTAMEKYPSKKEKNRRVEGRTHGTLGFHRRVRNKEKILKKYSFDFVSCARYFLFHIDASQLKRREANCTPKLR